MQHLPQAATPLQTLIGGLILPLRGQRVILDADLADLYDVQTKVLVQAVKRNLARFPTDFMFQLSPEDRNNLRSQFVTSNLSLKMDLPRQSYAFTEHGVTVMSAILDSERAWLPPEPPKRRIGFGAGDEDGIEG